MVVNFHKLCGFQPGPVCEIEDLDSLSRNMLPTSAAGLWGLTWIFRLKVLPASTVINTCRELDPFLISSKPSALDSNPSCTGLVAE